MTMSKALMVTVQHRTNDLQLALLFGTRLQQNALFLTQNLQVGNV